MLRRLPGFPELLSPGEVAQALRVNPKTVTRWCQEGWVQYIRTPGGHRRIPRAELDRLLARRTADS